MGSRFFLIPFLPVLQLGRPPELSLDEVLFYLNLNLSSHEMKQVHLLHTYYDILNTCSYFQETSMRERGSLAHDILREKIEEEELSLPGVTSFLSMYTSHDERKKNSNKLLRFFLQECPETVPPFIHSYFHFEHLFRLLFSWLRAKEIGKPFQNKENLGFNIEDSSEWPTEYSSLLSLWKNKASSARDFETEIAEWKFHTISDICSESSYFSLDFILSYLIRLRIIESQHELNVTDHIKTLEQMVSP